MLRQSNNAWATDYRLQTTQLYRFDEASSYGEILGEHTIASANHAYKN